MNKSNCSMFINNNNNNLNKFSFLKNSRSKNKINNNNNNKKKVCLNKNSKTQKHSPMIFHTKLQKNHFNIKTKNFGKNNNNNVSQTKTVVFNVNLSKNKENKNNIKIINKNFIKEKKLLLLNQKNSSSNFNIHKKNKTTKNSPNNNNNNNIHLRNKNFFPVKNTSQLTLNYINNIMTKIKLTNFKTTPLTTINSKKSSNEKKIHKNNENKSNENKSKNNNENKSKNKNDNKNNNKSKNKNENNNENKSNENKSNNNNNNKNKNNSINKIKNIIIPNSNHYKTLHNKFSILSNLTTKNNIKNNNNNKNKNERNKKIINNITQISKSYNFNKNESNNNKTNNNNKNKNSTNKNTKINKKSKNIVKNYYIENINININFPTNNNNNNNLIPITTNNKNKKRNNNYFNISNNNTTTSKKLNTSCNNSNNNKKKIKNNFTFKNYHLNERYFKNTKSNKNQKSNNTKKKSTSSMLNSNKKTNDISIKKKLSISNSSMKDFFYYKNESKKIKDFLINFYKKNNFYPKTTINFYKIGRSIGHGAFGKVNLALNILSGHIVAIKSFNKTKNSYSKSQIKYEIKLLKKLRNYKNIVKIYETFETNKYFCIVMENIIGGNLLNCINKMTKLSENQAKNIFYQLITTLEYIHSLGIVHRDIKPDNILLDLNNNIKLCDFGVALQTNTENFYINDKVGTPAFVAPEILSNNYYDPFKTDIWSAGVVLYSILAGIFPFRGNNEAELNKRILNGKFPNIDVSNDCMDLLKKILNVNPNERITIKEIKNHSWLNNNNNVIINLFTNAEKIIFSKMLVDYRKSLKEDAIENFTYKNLETDLEDENKNNESFSFIITPYNTKINEYYNDDDEDVYFKELIIEDNIMRFNPKINDFNVNYEIKFNKDADQGFVRKSGRKKNKMGSINNSLVENKKNENVIINNESENYFENKEIENNNIIITLEDEKNVNNNNNNKKKIEFNNNIIKLIEDFGYKKDFILKSLENNELNHCSALYYIYLTLLNEK